MAAPRQLATPKSDGADIPRSSTPKRQQRNTGLIVTAILLALGTVVIVSPFFESLNLLERGLRGYKLAGASERKEGSRLEAWIDHQANYSWDRLWENIGYDGTDKGCVIASPSTEEPDYWYQWTRDGAMVMDVVVSAYRAGDDKVLSKILDFIDETEQLQHLETSIGGYDSGGLADVKYHVNGTPFMGSWGRPQRDGPALRAITLIRFAFEYSRRRGVSALPLLGRLYDGKLPTNSIIKADLEHVANHVQEPGFDLWEEVNGMHHFTLLVSRRALRYGARFAEALGDSGAASFYRERAQAVSALLEEFWYKEGGYIVVSRNMTDDHGKKSLLDVGTLLGALHGSVVRGEKDESDFDEGDDWDWNDERILSTHVAAVESMRDVYDINKQYGSKSAIAVGRYPEDVYDGTGQSLGNPWYLCTLASAEVIYRHVEDRRRVGFFNVTPTSLAFYNRFGQTSPGVVHTTSNAGDALAQALKSYADGFFEVVHQYKRANGSLNEQFDRYDGHPRGARDLTWSYAAFLTAAESRRRVT